MFDSVTIRGAASGDEKSLERLIVDHATYEGSPAPPDGAGASVLRLQEAGRLWCWVAADAKSDELVGYASATEDVATFTGRPFGHMDCLFVTESHRRARIGHDLMKVVAAWSQSRGHSELQWQTPDWNTRAHDFYRRQGATGADKVRFRLTIES